MADATFFFQAWSALVAAAEARPAWAPPRDGAALRRLPAAQRVPPCDVRRALAAALADPGLAADAAAGLADTGRGMVRAMAATGRALALLAAGRAGAAVQVGEEGGRGAREK